MPPGMRLAASLPLPPDLAMCRRVAERAEALGYESLWIADTGAGPDAFVVGAVAAAVTRRLRIGTAVVPIYTRTPSVMAAAAGSLAQLAPGRVVLGLGASSETIVEAWGGVTFTGRTIQTRGFRLVSQPPQPVPIYVAALMPPMLELAGEIADGVVLNFFPREALPRILEHVRIGSCRAAADPAGIEVVSRFQVIVTDDRAAARQALRHMMGPYFATSVYNRFVAWCGFAHEAREILAGWQAKDRARKLPAVSDEMIDRLAIIGSAAECRAQLA